MYVLSIASLFYLFNTAMFCGNTRGKLPENQQLRKSKRAGTFGFKTQGIFDNTVSLEWGKLTGGI